MVYQLSFSSKYLYNTSDQQERQSLSWRALSNWATRKFFLFPLRGIAELDRLELVGNSSLWEPMAERVLKLNIPAKRYLFLLSGMFKTNLVFQSMRLEKSKIDRLNQHAKHHQLLSLQRATLVSDPTSDPTLTVQRGA